MTMAVKTEPVEPAEMSEAEQEATALEVGDALLVRQKQRDRALRLAGELNERRKDLKDIADELDEAARELAHEHEDHRQTHLFQDAEVASCDEQRDILDRVEAGIELVDLIWKAGQPSKVVKAAHKALD